MKVLEKVLNILKTFIDTCLSIVRLLLFTRFRRIDKIQRKHDSCIICGNAPSLDAFFTKNQDKLEHYDLLAVNFMAKSEAFARYKPNIYVLCDPLFWSVQNDKSMPPVVAELFQLMTTTITWDLQLFIPYQGGKYAQRIKQVLATNPHISVHFYNKTKFEGFVGIRHLIYSKQWGMPRTQNVLVASLTLALYSQYQAIYLAGAENDWLKNLSVNEHNQVCLNDTHFNITTYRVLPTTIAAQMQSLYYLFNAYALVYQFAQKLHIPIYNTCIKSFIDTFPKKELI